MTTTNSFASLLRSSRLATYDRSISQVYTTPLKKKANWGLKRDLPKVIRTKYVTIGALDTSDIKHLGNRATRPAPRLDTETHNIVRITPAQFNRFLGQVSKLASIPSIVKEERIESPAESPVGPTYSDYYDKEAPAYPVEGRILNAEKHGHAVGIAGVVAFLPKRHSMRLRQLGDRRVRTFYVESAHIDDEGKPKVVLTTTPPGTASLPFMLNFDDDVEEPFTSSHMFLKRKESIGRVDDHIKANPDHDKLMSRIAGLINKN
ncbi:unnamed protein product [Mucor hiemalis]